MNVSRYLDSSHAARTEGEARVAQRGAGRGRWGALGLLLIAAGPGCAQPEVLALEHEVYEVDAGVERQVNSGCDELPQAPGSGLGFGFGTAPGAAPVPYSVSYEFGNDSVSMSAGAFGGELAQREYDAAFLRAGDEDEFFVDLSDGFGLRVLNRGVPGGCGISN